MDVIEKILSISISFVYNNASGTVAARYEYDAFGSITAHSGPMAGDFRHRFSTKYYDPETGLYYYGERYSNPLLGRFISSDPIGEDGGLNLYGFCGNDPINKIDVLGNRAVSLYIYHNFPDNELTEGAKKETERIFQDCFKKCDEQKCHSVSIEWSFTDKNVTNYKELPLGKDKRKNPIRIGMFLDRDISSPFVGYGIGTYAFVNPEKIKYQAQNYDVGMGVSIAHEIGFHGIGEFTDFWSSNEGYVDSKSPPGEGSPVFSTSRCNTICKKIGIRTTKRK